MALQRYQLLSGDSEKGDSPYSLPTGHSNYSPRKGTSPSGNIIKVLGAIGCFFSGVIATLAIITIRSQYSGVGQYETGFREEKLCKSDHMFLIHDSM